MNASRVTCRYCFKPREFAEGWHDCHQAQDAKDKVEKAVAEIKALFEPKTSEPWNYKRKDRLNSMKTSIEITGGQVRQEQPNGND